VLTRVGRSLIVSGEVFVKKPSKHHR
jgi:hypothetical protein